MRSKKIKLYPTKDERETLKLWFGTRRWVYNQSLNYIKQNKGFFKSKVSKEGYTHKKDLRKHFINGPKLKEFSHNTPYEIRDGGMLDVLKNYNSNFALLRKNVIKHFSLGFIKSKRGSETFSVPSKCYGKGGYSILHEIKKSENIRIDQVNHDFRILKDSNGEYWMCLPIKKTSRSERQVREFSTNRLDGTISLDPGIRTFLVGYDSQRKCVVHIGNDGTKKIEEICVRMDLLISKKTKSKHKRKSSLDKAIRRLRKKIKNLVKDLHYKTAAFLCMNYKTIIIPTFNTKQMVQNKKLHSKVARKMLTLSHFLFRQRLISKSEEFENCVVEIVDESYTSKTCGKCGNIHKELGSNKVFCCPKCNVIMDRDTNGARNILLKNY